VRFLLDTHVALWATQDPARLPVQTREALVDEANAVIVSVASLWEMAIKFRLRRGKAGDMTVSAAQAAFEFEAAGFELLTIRPEHALAVSDLPPIHADPFDRMLIAQARIEPLRLITHDAAVATYGDWIQRI
jgi:PIN domain nuclease of toxin-antitoxin system